MSVELAITLLIVAIGFIAYVLYGNRWTCDICGHYESRAQRARFQKTGQTSVDVCHYCAGLLERYTEWRDEDNAYNAGWQE